MSIKILQTIRNANATADPNAINVNQQQQQLDEAIQIFQNMETEDEKFLPEYIKENKNKFLSWLE